ncbi:MAG TPA: NAD(P)-binding domain-containing protein [Actinomycetota bacterium]
MTTYGVLGTGTVGRALAGKLASLGHEVTMGTRDPVATLARTETDDRGNVPLGEWLVENGGVRLDTFAGAAKDGHVLVNAVAGSGSLEALGAVDPADLEHKILVDIANPLTWGPDGMGLTIAITDSLAETIQRTYPQLRVVKALNTVTARVMVDPGGIGGGDHTAFVAGDDPRAKTEVTTMLGTFGWRDVRDLGDLSAARGMEAYLLLWIREMQAFDTPLFNVKVVR